MTGMDPHRGQPPFDVRELDGASGSPEDLAATTRIARELEQVADRSGAAPTADFADRVMSVVASEPVPAPARAAATALRAGALGALIAALRDAWRVTTQGGFPAAVRAQAFAVVLIVVAVVSGSSLAAAGAVGLLEGDHVAPTPAVAPTPVPTIGPVSVEPDVTPSPTPTETVEPTPSPEPTTEPTDNAESTDHQDGEGGGAAPTVKPTKAPTRTTSPTATPTHEPEDDGEGSTEAPETEHPESTQQPQPTQQPQSD
jgi:hypothetical protein